MTKEFKINEGNTLLLMESSKEIIKILTGNELRLFLFIAFIVNEDNIFESNTTSKEKLLLELSGEDSNISIQSISNSLSSLVKKNALISVGNSNYKINLEYLQQTSFSTETDYNIRVLDSNYISAYPNLNSEEVADLLGWD